MTRVRYLGVIPQTGHREYGFNVEGEDKSVRQIILTIDDLVFSEKQLKFQEAPDLCYQKMKCDLESEGAIGPITSPVTVTPSDVAKYRDAHPDAKARHKRQQ
ncbi:MAG: hypothetical protein DMG08_10005 [Acidobacteria bacterium]|nr:MAG: hypothetical protein DMG08_10005 [Acidobacteriota bacterium]